MRLYRVKLSNPKLRIYLRELSRVYRIPDVGFVQDLFCLVRAKGSVPALTDDSVKAIHAEIAKASPMVSIVSVRLMLSKRKAIMSRLAKSAIGQAAIRLKDPLEATRRLLAGQERLSDKVAASICRSCSLLKSCTFGTKYGASVSNITSAFSLAEPGDVHANCPERGNFENVQSRMERSLQLMEQLAAKNRTTQTKGVVSYDENGTPQGTTVTKVPGGGGSGDEPTELTPEEMQAVEEELSAQHHDEEMEAYIDEDSPKLVSNNFECGASAHCYRTSHASGASMLATEQVIEDLSKTDLDLFFLAKEIAAAMAQLDSPEDKATLAVTNKSRQKTLRQVSEITRAPATVQSLPDDVLDAKIARKEIHIKKHRKPDKKRFLRYILLDTSGSMDSILCRISKIFYTRSAVAVAFVGAMINRAETNDDIIYLRTFEGSPGTLIQGTDAASYQTMRRYVMGCSFNGGGTDIFAALGAAYTDISSADAASPLRGAQITLMTDGLCRRIAQDANRKLMAKWFKEIPLNTLDFGVMMDSDTLPARMKLHGSTAAQIAAFKTTKAPLRDCSDNYFEFTDDAPSIKAAVATIAGKKRV